MCLFSTGEDHGCGGTKNLTDGAVTLTSIDLDRNGNYDDDLDCQWLLIAPEFKLVEVTFSSFSMQSSQGLNRVSNVTCPYDYLEVKILSICVNEMAKFLKEL